MKESGEQFDDRIVECSWDLHGGPKSTTPGGEVQHAPAWRLHRIRDDKHDGNHTSVVEKILLSIQDGVEEEQLLLEEEDIRKSWKSTARTELRNNPEGSSSGGGASSGVGGPASTQQAAVAEGGRRGPPPPMRGTPPDWLKRR